MDEKYSQLRKFLGRYKKIAIAFSGGVDSSLLLYAAAKLDGLEVVAVTAVSELVPEWEIRAAKNLAAQLNVTHILVEPDPLAENLVRSNPPERCYYCKKIIIAAINQALLNENVDAIIEGSNLDDGSDYRPGSKAVKEAGLVSPFIECGFSKDDIRRVSEELGVTGWERPSCACLASRIPYGTELDAHLLKKIEKAEEALAAVGYAGARLRAHGDIGRLEVAPQMIEQAAQDHYSLSAIIKAAGFKYAALDLQGYRTGSLNEALNK